ncbi:Lipid-a-disaccharide synthase, partial [Globisporangium splendens]
MLHRGGRCRCALVTQRPAAVALLHDRYASTLQQQQVPMEKKKIYLIAGEASGDAIGAKVIHALVRKQAQGDPRAQALEFRGVGGPLMCSAGGFLSLFPMHELSVMGLVEVLPFLWRFRQRIHATLADIRAYEPDVVLTIDSKGFTFRVLKALYADPATRDSTTRMHYVAPSVWAYKHRRKNNFTELSRLLHRMFTILPFEDDIFNAKQKNNASDGGGGERWCQFVGHPAVEDFLEFHGQFDGQDDNENMKASADESDVFTSVNETKTPVAAGADALLDLSKYNWSHIEAHGSNFERLMHKGRDAAMAQATRARFGVPENAIVICALVGSRANEVRKTMEVVAEGIEKYQASIANTNRPSADAAIAVSGTIVMETTLAGLPTIVVYRANRITEVLAQRLAAVRFVSIPNLLLGRPLLPELLFHNCTATNLDAALRVAAPVRGHPVAASFCEERKRNKRMANLRLSTKSEWHRDLLFAAGCSLVGVGLFPYVHAYYHFAWLQGGASVSSGNYNNRASQEVERIVHPSTNTAFDLMTCFVSLMFALFGSALMVLSSLVLPRRATRFCLKTVGMPLAVIAAGAAMLVVSIYAENDLAAAWKRSALGNFSATRSERQLEHYVNQIYCHAFGDKVCREGDLADAKMLFVSLQSWPRNRADHASVSEMCRVIDSFDDKRENAVCRMCRVCSRIQRHARNQHDGASLLNVLKAPSQASVQWCGHYLSSGSVDMGQEVAKSPYQQHRRDVLEHWGKSPISLYASAHLLTALVLFSVPSVATMARWYFSTAME